MEFQLVFWLIKGLIFITFISILVILTAIAHMAVLDIFVCILTFMLTLLSFTPFFLSHQVQGRSQKSCMRGANCCCIIVGEGQNS